MNRRSRYLAREQAKRIATFANMPGWLTEHVCGFYGPGYEAGEAWRFLFCAILASRTAVVTDSSGGLAWREAPGEAWRRCANFSSMRIPQDELDLHVYVALLCRSAVSSAGTSFPGFVTPLSKAFRSSVRPVWRGFAETSGRPLDQ